MSTQNHIPVGPLRTGQALPGQPDPGRGLGFFRELKLLFAALGAGTNVVPMGDNTRTARMLAEYAASLRRH